MKSHAVLAVVLMLALLCGACYWIGRPTIHSDHYLNWAYVKPATTWELWEIQWHNDYRWFAILAQRKGKRVPSGVIVNTYANLWRHRVRIQYGE